MLGGEGDRWKWDPGTLTTVRAAEKECEGGFREKVLEEYATDLERKGHEIEVLWDGSNFDSAVFWKAVLGLAEWCGQRLATGHQLLAGHNELVLVSDVSCERRLRALTSSPLALRQAMAQVMMGRSNMFGEVS